MLFFAGLEAWSTFAAAIIGLGAGIAIAVQIYYTRRSISLTKDSVVLTQESVEATKAAINESRKQRVDQEMPKLTLTVLSNPDVATRASFDQFARHEAPEPIPDGTVFRTSRDNGVMITAITRVNLRNDGPRLAKVALTFPFAPAQNRDVVVQPHADEIIDVPRTMQLNYWLTTNEFRSSPTSTVLDWNGNAITSTAAVIMEATYTYPGDVGAIETHQVVQDGQLMWKQPEDDAGWYVGPFAPGNDNLASVVPQFTRVYYESIERKKVME